MPTMTSTPPTPPTTPTLLERLLLLDAAAVEASLQTLADNARTLSEKDRRLLPPGALPERFPSRAQVEPDAFGLSSSPPRLNLRARLLRNRTVRLPFLLAVGSVVPGDLSGMRSSPAVVRRHLLGTHHDVMHGVAQARYDLELLALHPGELQGLRDECAAVVDGSHPRASLYRDLCVYQGYHEGLLALVDDVLKHGLPYEADPDASFFAMLRWCATQPDAPPRWRSVWGEAAAPVAGMDAVTP
jgi:hypothetical protein